MIAFATIFLGLVLGVQDVELVVGEGVATVEVLLSGRPVAALSGEPWKLECDFGAELAPQELVAIARDENGRELERTRQWINMPQPPARVTVAIDEAEEGKPAIARLSWESTAGAEPRAFEISFDGTLLATEDPRVVVLPLHNPRQLHFLRAELEFSENVTSIAEVTFGGTYADQVSTELTAVPLRARGRKIRKEGALAGLLTKKGEPLEVVAVERGAAQIILVPAQGVLEALDALSHFRFEGNPSFNARARKLRSLAGFAERQYVRILWPVGRRQQGQRQRYDLFSLSNEYHKEAGGLYFVIYHAFQDPRVGVQRLADAVAVAGLQAAEQRQGRFVILLLAGAVDEEDRSQLTPRQARGYLKRLGVPFQVWSLTGEDAGTWGEAVDVSSLTKFERATRRMSQELGQQWLVWVDGVHLPQEIELAGEAKGLELVN